MTRIRTFLPGFAFLAVLLASPGMAAPGTEDRIPTHVIRRAPAPLTIDGNFDEPAWQAARTVGDWVFPWWRAGAREQTRARLLWDEEYLYLAFECDDAHITARHVERDGKIPEDDCVELMLAPDAARPQVYFNIEFNVLGGILDNFRPHGPHQPRAPKWDAEGVKIAGAWTGTLNDDRDTDRSWRVEVAIPWRNFAAYMKSAPPRAGSEMRLNLNRSGGRTNPQFSQWASGGTPKPAFHTPDRFGRVTLSDEIASARSP